MEVTNNGVNVKQEFMAVSGLALNDEQGIITALDDRYAMVATTNGSLHIGLMDLQNNDIKFIEAQSPNSSENYQDILACRRLGGFLVASSYQRLMFVSLDGSRIHFTEGANFRDIPYRLIRLDAEERHLGLNVNSAGYAAVKVFRDFHKNGTENEQESTIYVRCFEDDEDADEKLITDFQFLPGDRIVSGTSEGFLHLHKLDEPEKAVASLNVCEDNGMGVSSVAVNADGTFAAVLSTFIETAGKKKSMMTLVAIVGDEL